MNSVAVWSGDKLQLGKIPLQLKRSTVPVLRSDASVYLMYFTTTLTKLKKHFALFLPRQTLLDKGFAKMLKDRLGIDVEVEVDADEPF
jgi:hypothetical protein